MACVFLLATLLPPYAFRNLAKQHSAVCEAQRASKRLASNSFDQPIFLLPLAVRKTPAVTINAPSTLGITSHEQVKQIFTPSLPFP